MDKIKVKIEKVSPIKKRVTVEIPYDDFMQFVEQGYEKLAKTAQIAGFRQGKVPRDVIRQKFEGRILSEAGSTVIEKSFPEALKQNKLMPLARPDFEVRRLEEGSPFIYTGTFEVVPDIDIKDYKGMEFQMKSVEVTAEEIDNNLIKICDSHAEFKPVERKAEEGDMVMIDFDGFIGGKPMKDGAAKDYPVVVGDNLLPGFDEVLEDSSAGDEFDVQTRFPDEYHVPDLRGKDASFKVTVKGVRVRQVPPLDNEIAKVLGSKTVAELRAKIIKEAKASKEFNEKERLRGEAIDRLIDINPIEIPPSMKKRYFDGVLKTVENMSKDEQGGFKTPAMTPELKVKYQQIAELHARRDLIIEAIATKENLEATDKEVEQAVERIAKETGEESDRMMAKIQREGSIDSIRTGIRHEKVFDLLLENCKPAEDTSQESKK